MGLEPVEAMVYKNGLPGVAPKTLAELICGVLGEGGVRIYFSSTLGVVRGLASPIINIFASAKLV